MLLTIHHKNNLVRFTGIDKPSNKILTFKLRVVCPRKFQKLIESLDCLEGKVIRSVPCCVSNAMLLKKTPSNQSS